MDVQCLFSAHKCYDHVADGRQPRFRLRMPSVAEPYFVRVFVRADDALLLDARQGAIQYLIVCVEECGQQCGLSLNWQKVEVIRVRTAAYVISGAGVSVSRKPFDLCRGAVVCRRT